MNGRKSTSLPLARHDDLVITELGEETLVYDQKTHQAHCLNSTAAIVWRLCDGRQSVPQIVAALEKSTGQKAAEDVVWLALKQLDGCELLDRSSIEIPKKATVSRREVLRKAGIAAAITLPLISSVVAPDVAEAATCLHISTPCLGSQVSCCPGLTCCTTGLRAGTCQKTCV